MAVKQQEAQNPLILRCNRLIEAFTKSDDERDFYLDRLEGFLIYVDIDKSDEELQVLEAELQKNKDRYCMIPKLTFYETKKIMEGFVNEKVYDIDTKEKLLDIIQSKEARENFLDFIYDHHSELEKWQTYYQERSRIRIIEWLRNNHFHFVFEEDLDLPKLQLEKLKKELFQIKVGKDVLAARKNLFAKAKTYYSNEALNPRPKRGRPPKQAQKAEIEPQASNDIYITVPQGLGNFLFTPDLGSPSSATFSSKFGNEAELFSSRRVGSLLDADISQENFNQKLLALRNLSNKWIETDSTKDKVSDKVAQKKSKKIFEDLADDDEDDFEDDEDDVRPINGLKSSSSKQRASQISPRGKNHTNAVNGLKKTTGSQEDFKTPILVSKNAKELSRTKASPKAPLKTRSPASTVKTSANALPKTSPPAKAKAAPKIAAVSKSPSKGLPNKKKNGLRPIMKLKKKK